MPDKKKVQKEDFWTNNSYNFKKIHFILGVVAVCIIVPCGFYIYKQFFPSSFTPDVNEVTQLPSDVKKIEAQFLKSPNPKTDPLEENLPKALGVPIPTSIRIPVLLYHYVEYVQDKGDKIRISLNIEPWILDNQIKTLKDAGYTFITPSDIPKIFEGKEFLPHKSIILSFDDGYRDFYTDAYPILKKYNVRAIEYIVPGFLDQHNNLTKNQLEEISKNGLIEIGDHTVYHTYLAGLNKDRVLDTVLKAKNDLETELNIKIVSFAYPYGAFDLNAIEAVKQAGLLTAVSTVPGVEINRENLFFIPRLRPGGRTGKNLLSWLDEQIGSQSATYR